MKIEHENYRKLMFLRYYIRDKELKKYACFVFSINKGELYNMDKTEKLLYSVSEASSALGVNNHIVYELINKGLLPAMKLGTKKIRKKSLEDFVEKYEGMDLSDLDNIIELNKNIA